MASGYVFSLLKQENKQKSIILWCSRRPQMVCFGNMHKLDPSSICFTEPWVKHLQQTKDNSFLFFITDTDRLTQVEHERRTLWFLQLQKVKSCDKTPNAALEDRNVRGAILVSFFLLCSMILLKYRHAELCNQAPALIYTNQKKLWGVCLGGHGVNEACRWRQHGVYVSYQGEWCWCLL